MNSHEDVHQTDRINRYLIRAESYSCEVMDAHAVTPDTLFDLHCLQSSRRGPWSMWHADWCANLEGGANKGQTSSRIFHSEMLRAYYLDFAYHPHVVKLRTFYCCDANRLIDSFRWRQLGQTSV